MCGQQYRAARAPRPAFPGADGLPEPAPSTGFVGMRKDRDAKAADGPCCKRDPPGTALLPGMLIPWEQEGTVYFFGTVGNPTVVGQVGRDWSGRDQAHTPMSLIGCALKMSKTALLI